ncbi:DNA topoisomerase 1 [Agyrium rufum]|nr:DNA topoisomerase 1 [Agyrium rufum]
MSSSDDDIPLTKRRQINGTSTKPKSSDVVPKSVDKAMDKSLPSNHHIEPGISIRHGPVQEMEIEGPEVNGAVHTNGKRKTRPSTTNGRTYKEASSDDNDDTSLSKRRRVSGKIQASPDSDSDDAPLLSKPNLNKSGSPVVLRKPPKASETALGESDDSDTPLTVKLAEEKKHIEKRAEKEAATIAKESKKPSKTRVKKQVTSDSSDDEPLTQKKKKQQVNGTAKPNAALKTNGIKKESDEDVPPAKKSTTKASKVRKEVAGPASAKKMTKDKAAKKEAVEEEEKEEEEKNKWWDKPIQEDDSIKWTTLQHNGVVFPPPYEPLPTHVRMLYDSEPVTMHPEAEEIAGFFGGMLNSTHNVENPTFQKNFFEDFTAKLRETGGAKNRKGEPVKIKEFEKCDFKPIFEHFDAQRTAKKAQSGAEKKSLKAEKDKAEEPFLYCLWDGKKQKVGNFRVEPPSLFRGRGEHPKTGRVKQRVKPEQITINIGTTATVPTPPEGHRWKEIKHDQEGTWLAMWQENINGAYKYVMLAANSDKHIARIRKDYNKELKAQKMADRQRATAVYLIDQFALRAGNEKGEEEADTVGCCSLKVEHVQLKPPNTVIFDFLGKDSIRFLNEVSVDAQVFKNLRIFKNSPKVEGDEIFDRLTTSSLNKHLSSYMPGLTAKVFRTYNASWTMSTLLQEMEAHGSVQEKIKKYNDANRKVAVICNHKRTVTANHETQMEKMTDRIKGLKYQQWRIRQSMLVLDPKLKKKKGADYFALPDDLTEEWVHEHQAFLVEEQKTKIQKKFEKENEKLVAEGKKKMTNKELQERLEVAIDLEKKFKKENKTKKVEPEGKAPTIEKLESLSAKFDPKMEVASLQAEDKDNNKDVALGTSKINYIDPRLTVVFCRKFNVPIEKLFSKTLREKFQWAIESVDDSWTF